MLRSVVVAFTAMTASNLFHPTATALEDNEAQADAPLTSFETNWTHTYLKATDGNREALREFLEQNWFEMDRIAVERGLFRDYQMIENLAVSTSEAPTEWDYIVAVEYYGDETYADIAEGFEAIRGEHEVQLIDGLGLRDLGKIVKGERIRSAPGRPVSSACQNTDFSMVNPFLGIWDEFNAADESGQPFGILEFRIEPNTCSLEKRFEMHGSDFAYTTRGHYSEEQNTWSETFTFSNGRSISFTWKTEDGQVYMYRDLAMNDDGNLGRNLWTNATAESFDIISQVSTDQGETWHTQSVTRLERRG